MTDLGDSLEKLKKLKKKPDGFTSNEWKDIRQGIGELQKRKEFDPKYHKAKTQSDLAKMFIKWYFVTILIVLAYVPAYNMVAFGISQDQNPDLISVKDVFMMVSAAITPILAFVLGHYFKGKD